MSWARAEQGDAAWTAQAEGESSGRNAERELKLQAGASVAPVRVVSWARDERGDAACAVQAEGESSGLDAERELKLQAEASVSRL